MKVYYIFGQLFLTQCPKHFLSEYIWEQSKFEKVKFLFSIILDAIFNLRICIVKLFKMTIFEINFLTPLLFQDNELINGQGTNIWTLDFTITEHWLALIFDTTVCTKVCINGTGHLVSRLMLPSTSMFSM